MGEELRVHPEGLPDHLHATCMPWFNGLLIAKPEIGFLTKPEGLPGPHAFMRQDGSGFGLCLCYGKALLVQFRPGS